MSDMKTLTGLTLEEAIVALDAELPADAYKPVPGGAQLTDIDPNHMRKVLNEIFGLCGFGWGYRYDPQTIHTRAEVQSTRSGERTVMVATVKYLELWYKLVVAGETVTSEPIPATGASENSNDSYALKGALTNALGNAASNLGFQLSVYLGQRSHKTVGKAPARKSAPKKSAPRVKGRPTAAPAGEIEDLDAPAPLAATRGGNGDVGSYVVPIGKHEGKTLAEVSRKAVEWYAHDLAPSTPQAQELQEKALAYLEVLATA